MTIGNTTTQSITKLNADLGDAAIKMRDACLEALQFFQGINSIGVSELQVIGFTPTDAQNMFNAANQLNTIAAVYFGTAAQTPAFNFDNALSEARGGN